MRIVTVEDLETALGKPFGEFTTQEKELIGKRYSVVSSATSPDFDAAQKLKTRARHDIVKSGFRIVGGNKDRKRSRARRLLNHRFGQVNC